jgi:hypothetical protein
MTSPAIECLDDDATERFERQADEQIERLVEVLHVEADQTAALARKPAACAFSAVTDDHETAARRRADSNARINVEPLAGRQAPHGADQVIVGRIEIAPQFAYALRTPVAGGSSEFGGRYTAGKLEWHSADLPLGDAEQPVRAQVMRAVGRGQRADVRGLRRSARRSGSLDAVRMHHVRSPCRDRRSSRRRVRQWAGSSNTGTEEATWSRMLAPSRPR